MTHDEIRLSIREAVNPVKQVGILSQLNDCSPATIIEIVKDILEDPDAVYDEYKIDILTAEGYLDKDIARVMNTTEAKVKQRRASKGVARQGNRCRYCAAKKSFILLYVSVDRHHSVVCDFNINFCPLCGRKIEDR